MKLGRTQGKTGREARSNGRLAVILAALAVALAVPVAHASIPIKGTATTLDSTTASTQTRFRLHLDLSGSEHIKDMTTQLPSGLGVNPDFPLCAPATFLADGCPANTQVGTTSVNVTVAGFLPQDVGGRIYYLSPDPGVIAPGLGIILDNPQPFPKVFQRGETQVDGKRGGITTTVRNFPRSTGGTFDLPIRLNSIDILLSKDFIRVPGACIPASTVFSVTSYEDPSVTTSSTSTFTPSGCAPPAPPKCNGTKTTLRGTAGRDVIKGTKGRDVIAGLGGNDTVKGLGGNDILCGGKGKDKIFGGAGKDTLLGGPSRDILKGGAGRDVLKGGNGKNSLTP